MKAIEHRQDWTKFELGDEVVVVDTNDNQFPGIVDAKTANSEVIWVVDHQGRGRRAFDHRDEIKVLHN